MLSILINPYVDTRDRRLEFEGRALVFFFFVGGGGAATLEHVLSHSLRTDEFNLEWRQRDVDLVVVRLHCLRMEVSLDAVVCEGDEAGCHDDTDIRVSAAVQ